MANSEEPQPVFQETLGLQEKRSTRASVPAGTSANSTGFLTQFLGHERSAAALYMFLDVVSWLANYRVVGWYRYDAFHARPFQVFIINVIQLDVIVTALELS